MSVIRSVLVNSKLFEPAVPIRAELNAPVVTFGPEPVSAPTHKPPSKICSMPDPRGYSQLGWSTGLCST
jgi:hypothetical protein